MTAKAVWLCVSLASVLGASAWATPTMTGRLSRFTQPGTLAVEARLRDEEDRALAAADEAVSTMIRVARTRAEQDLARHDSQTLAAIRPLVLKRRSIRQHEEALGGQAAGGATPIGSVTGGGGSSAQLMAATQQMQETQMSFNLQYLQLQNAMQNENRQFLTVSGVVKLKHDVAKNSINNIR